MKWKSPRPTAYRRPAPRPVRTGPLLCVDSRTIRKKSLASYERALRDLDKVKAELDRFQTNDRPAFDRWFHRLFGALLTEGRELQAKFAELQHIVGQVDWHMMRGARSCAEAYARYLHDRDHPPEAEPDPEPESEPHDIPPRGGRFRSPFDDIFGDDLGGDLGDHFSAEQRAAFNDFARRLGFDLGGDPFTDAAPTGGPAATPPPLKDLYRRIVRRLHPDSGRKLTAKETEWWHEAQDAYERGDHQALELILTLCEIQDHGTKNARVSILAELTARCRSTLRHLRRQLRESKLDPAWNFAVQADRPGVERRIRADLTRQNQYFHSEIQQLQATIDRWQAQAQALAARRAKSASAPSPDPQRPRRPRPHRNPFQTEFF